MTVIEHSGATTSSAATSRGCWRAARRVAASRPITGGLRSASRRRTRRSSRRSKKHAVVHGPVVLVDLSGRLVEVGGKFVTYAALPVERLLGDAHALEVEVQDLGRVQPMERGDTHARHRLESASATAEAGTPWSARWLCRRTTSRGRSASRGRSRPSSGSSRQSSQVTGVVERPSRGGWTNVPSGSGGFHLMSS